MSDLTATKIQDPNNSDLSTIFSFRPATMEHLTLGDMRVNDSIIGALNIPVTEGKFIVTKSNESKWEAPIIEPSYTLTIQESIDKGMAQHVNAIGATEIIGWLTVGYEFQGERSTIGTTVVTVFKAGDLNMAELSDTEYAVVTLEEIKQMFDDSPLDFPRENVFFDIFQAAIEK